MWRRLLKSPFLLHLATVGITWKLGTELLGLGAAEHLFLWSLQFLQHDGFMARKWPRVPRGERVSKPLKSYLPCSFVLGCWEPPGSRGGNTGSLHYRGISASSVVRITCGMGCTGVTVFGRKDLPHMLILFLLNKLIQGLCSLSSFILTVSVICEFAGVMS